MFDFFLCHLTRTLSVSVFLLSPLVWSKLPQPSVSIILASGERFFFFLSRKKRKEKCDDDENEKENDQTLILILQHKQLLCSLPTDGLCKLCWYDYDDEQEREKIIEIPVHKRRQLMMKMQEMDMEIHTQIEKETLFERLVEIVHVSIVSLSIVQSGSLGSLSHCNV